MSTQKKENDLIYGVETLVRICADLKPNESALIVSDETTFEIGDLITGIAKDITYRVKHVIINPFIMHGEEPPKDIADEMIKNTVVFGVTKMSMAHSKACLNAIKVGTRYLSLPDYSIDVLTSSALRFDFRTLTPLSNRLAMLLTNGNEIEILTESCNSFILNISGRKGNAAPGWCWGPGTLASPPDAEANIAPIENKSYGTIAIDGSIPCPKLGLLKEPVILTVEEGRIVHIDGKQADTLNEILNQIDNPLSRMIGEFGIGLNPLAKLRGFMLEDEGCFGTVHLGFGSNKLLGGINIVPFHLDMVIHQVTVIIDGKTIINNGQMIKELKNELN